MIAAVIGYAIYTSASVAALPAVLLVGLVALAALRAPDLGHDLWALGRKAKV